MAGRLRVLHIEDDEFTREIVKERCKSVALVQVDTLAAGLSMLTLHSFDVVLTDLGLPDSHGMDTLQALVDRDALVVVASSAADDEWFAEQVLARGAADYLPKDSLMRMDVGAKLRFIVARANQLAERRLRFTHVDDVKPYLFSSVLAASAL